MLVHASLLCKCGLTWSLHISSKLLSPWICAARSEYITSANAAPQRSLPDATQFSKWVHDSWRKTAQTHVTTTWPNEPHVSVASEAHGPRTRLSHAHICSSFLYNVFLHPELYNYFLFYTFSKLHLWWV